MAICRRSTSPLAIVFMVIFIIALIVLLIAVGYSAYANYYSGPGPIIIEPQPEPEGPSSYLQVEGMNLTSANLAGSVVVDNIDACQNLLETQSVGAVAAVFDSDTNVCALKGQSAGSGYVVDSSKTVLLSKAPVSYLLNWTRTEGSDVQGSEIFCSALIGSQERAAALCATDSTCQAYNMYVSSADGVMRGCIKSATTPLVADTTNQNIVVYTNPSATA